MGAIRTLIWIALYTYGVASGSCAEDTIARVKYPYKSDIVTTCFWVGEGRTPISSTDNTKSAWDSRWVENFGGVDSPVERTATTRKPGAVSLPAKFVPHKNPYYVALPFNDIRSPEIARKVVPWWDEAYYRANPTKSQCQGRWIKIHYQGRVCYAQWEDVGPLRDDHYEYVFGNERPTLYTKAGLDVSPAVRDYLALDGLDKTTWRFVDRREVPMGPWINPRYLGPMAEAQPPRPRTPPTIRLPIASTGALSSNSYYGATSP